MLNSLTINHFAIIQSAQITFNSGMTVITGETGAGKSILLDALQLALGARADKAMLKDQQKTTITAVFDIKNLLAAQNWLKANDLNTDDSECILRRTLQKDGSSKAYINATPVTLIQIKALAELLIGIYGQHAHYDLLSPKEQLIKLDTYINEPQLIEIVKQKFNTIKSLKLKFNELKEKQKQTETEQSLIAYQLAELTELALEQNEFEQLGERQNQLAYAQDRLNCLYQVCDLLSDCDENLIGKLNATLQNLSQNFNRDAITNPFEMLEQAQLLIKEAYDELNHLKDQIEINPEALETINQRLSEIYQVSRKHQSTPENLYEHQIQLAQRLDRLNHLDDEIKQVENKLQEAEIDYDQKALLLSNKRKEAAKHFSQKVTEYIHKLNIPKGAFEIIFSSDATRNETGIDLCEFMISFNPGQPLMPIQKVASGGELSRIGLSIQVTASEKIAPPTLIFDEVDVGISGATAEIVGKLLTILSKKAQVLCITHQAQVAAQGHYHLHVHKEQSTTETYSFIKQLDENEKIHAIAQMIGGVDLSNQTIAHAKEMIDKFSSQIDPN